MYEKKADVEKGGGKGGEMSLSARYFHSKRKAIGGIDPETPRNVEPTHGREFYLEKRTLSSTETLKEIGGESQQSSRRYSSTRV